MLYFESLSAPIARTAGSGHQRLFAAFAANNRVLHGTLVSGPGGRPPTPLATMAALVHNRHPPTAQAPVAPGAQVRSDESHLSTTSGRVFQSSSSKNGR